MTVLGLLPLDIARTSLLKIMGAFGTHPIKTAEKFREAALDGLFAFSPALAVTKGALVNSVVDAVQTTVSEGRMIDFGFIPSAMLAETSTRTRDVFEAGELQHPYETWLAVSSWEGGMCGYLITPLHDDPEGDDSTIVVEIYGVAAPDLPLAVVINDLCAIHTPKDQGTLIRPSPMLIQRMNEQPEVDRRTANMLDPLVTFLRLLADASVPVIDVPAPEKLNKQRALKGKLPIPAHTRVETRDYVSLFQAHKRAETNSGGQLVSGHHASPVPHWRRSHQRHLASGKVIPVRSTKVNWRDTEELHRLFSRVKKVST